MPDSIPTWLQEVRSVQRVRDANEERRREETLALARSLIAVSPTPCDPTADDRG
jgi:hypothetical protein